MVFRGLKSNILINIAVIVFIGMLLINFVTVMTVQRDLIRSEIARGHLLLSIIEQHLFASSGDGLQAAPVYPIEMLSQRPELVCVAVLDEQGQIIFRGGAACEKKDTLIAGTKESIRMGRPTTRYSGKTWGIFWLQDRYLTASLPFFRNGTIVGGAGVTTSLKPIYDRQRRSQKAFFIYIFINTIILTFVGVYRISKIYLVPLQRLARRAEEYREDDGQLFTVRKEDNDLHQLSQSLNLMLERISEDKKTLRFTVMSLEKANNDLKQAQKEIIRAEKLASVGRLSAGIAHEIGNPIGIVMGYLELLRQKDITEEEKFEYIHRTVEEINRINTIIRQLLDLSRPSKDGIAPIHVHEIINDITNVTKFQPLMSGISIKLSLAAANDVVVADPNQLRQVFLNLMINAADAISSKSPPVDGELIIKSEIESDPYNRNPSSALKITVSDNGPGISPENLGNIFDPFFTTKETGKGTGLGLSVSFMIIESVNGKITVASDTDKGTTMVIHLPLCGDEAAMRPDEATL